MRFSEIGGKEIVNLCNGSRLGVIGDSDMLIDEKTGKILALLVPNERSMFNFLSNGTLLEIPWEAIKKIGNDMIIIEVEDEEKKKIFL
ncbi:YlmC/YmxH family sporulation protein [Alkaliphilus pronyensis]|uniref:YlmC/YmxH family sporulation protein n=1 Tax=Alkaliphilus pronyensis TaxID=1482732 RepID=A0A6I0FKA8_9FIRM|nr:YlmC/YmxH family sporulation protein [Alkaliphilus pronyensis]KAB3536954.1 YlmC/YmxH family sporulation protein [Alkaliphilus pronyensis]